MSGTYKDVQEYVKKKYGFVPKTCWITHAKELCGIKVKRAWNRTMKKRKYPCPKDKFPAIKEALNNFGFLNKNNDTN